MKYALVTGANSDVGKSICEKLLEQNYEVIACCHLSASNLNDLNVTIKYCDLRDEEQIKNLVKNYNLSVLVNAAAYSCDDLIENKTSEEFLNCFKINTFAHFLLIKYANIKDYIINISSSDSIDTYNEYNYDYAASKAALNNLTKSLSLVTKAKIVALAPNWINTKNIEKIDQEYLKEDMLKHHQEKLVTLDDIKNYIGKILNDEYQTGSIIRIDGVNEDVY